MDDLEFRRTIYSDPNTQSDDVKAACKTDSSKKQFVDDMQKFDAEILAALSVKVPDSLSERIILDQSLKAHSKQKRSNRIQLALAASIAFALGLSFTLFQNSRAFSDVGEHALAHVYHEEGYYSNRSNNRVTLASLNDKMSTYNASFMEQAGELIAANFCRFGGNRSLHLAFQGKTDVVNVFIVPEKDSLAFVETFKDDKLKGIASLQNKHHIIVVSDDNESLVDWQSNINKAIRWSI